MASNVAERSLTGAYLGHLSADPTHGPVGTVVSLQGKRFSAHQKMQLVWETYDADWSIERRDGVDWEKFYGIEFSERTEVLGEVQSDENGAFETQLAIPEDYGGMHDLYAVDAETGDRLAKVGFRVDVSAEISPSSGPIGTPIDVTVYGLHPAHPFEGWYELFYDNGCVGNLTAVTTRGTAQAQVPATGHVGSHLIELKVATYGWPFIQIAVSPYPHVKTPQLRFELTEGEPVTPPPAREQLQPERPADRPTSSGDPMIWTDYAEIPARSAITLYGECFPKNAELELVWIDISGDRVTEVRDGVFGTGFSELSRILGTVITDDDGTFETTVVPESVQGGAHPVRVYRGDECLAQTYVTLGRRPYPIRPTSGPVGTRIDVEMEGVGWTQHENEVAVCYDNAYIGYTCGADLMGKVKPEVYATGVPGPHYLDLYPTFRNPSGSVEGDDKPIYFRRPILTWRDHPHGFHVRHVFHVEEDSP